MADPIKQTIDSIIAALEANSKKLDSISGAKAFADLAESLFNFSRIDWTSFGTAASKGLKSLGDSLKPEDLKAVSNALEGLSAESKLNASAFTELSKGLSTFATIDWAGVIFGLDQLSALKDSFTNARDGIMAFTGSIKGLSKSGENIEAFNQLGESLKVFSDITWDEIREGFEQLSKLGAIFANAKKGLQAFALAISELSESEANFSAFNTLSEALKTFASIEWGNVAKGLIMMSVLPGLIRMAAKGFQAFGQAVEGLKRYKDSFQALNTLMTALKNFSEIKWKNVFYGLIALRMMSGLFGGFGKAVDALGQAIGSKKSKATIESFGMFVSALSEFGQISWGKVLLGLGIMKLFGGMFKTFSAMAGPLNATVKMLKVFARGLGMAITELGAFAVDPLFIAGMIALAAFGFVLLEFGAACALAGAGVLLLAIGFERLLKGAFEGINKIVELANKADNMFKAAKGIGAIALALAAFGVAAAASGIGSAIGGVLGKITGSSPIDQILKLAEASDKLDKTATALERINRAMGGMPSSSGVDLSAGGAQGADLASQRGVAGAGGVGAVIKTGAKAISNKVSSVVVNNSFMPDRSTALVLAPAI